MARGNPKILERQVYDMTPKNGVYLSDIYARLLHHYTMANIDEVLANLCKRGVLRRCGLDRRPLYVRMQAQKVFYSNIAPLPPGTEQVLKTMDSNYHSNGELR